MPLDQVPGSFMSFKTLICPRLFLVLCLFVFKPFNSLSVDSVKSLFLSCQLLIGNFVYFL